MGHTSLNFISTEFSPVEVEVRRIKVEAIVICGCFCIGKSGVKGAIKAVPKYFVGIKLREKIYNI